MIILGLTAFTVVWTLTVLVGLSGSFAFAAHQRDTRTTVQVGALAFALLLSEAILFFLLAQLCA